MRTENIHRTKIVPWGTPEAETKSLFQMIKCFSLTNNNVIFVLSQSLLLTCLKFRKGTNWTMSRRTGSPLGDRRIPSSPSSICMSLKSAFPTPTMIMDIGRWEAWTMASRVSAMSVMTPSVRISRMKYCWTKNYQEAKGQIPLHRSISLFCHVLFRHVLHDLYSF